MLDPQQFVERWSTSQLGERQAAQSHFIELCQLISHAPPSQYDQSGNEFCFEKPVSTVKGSKGFADVWYKDHFAWEYKGKHKDLDAAYDQLSAYRGGLDNPPLLVVCDFLEYRIYPQWPNMDGYPIVFRNEDLVDPLTLRYIRWLLEDPTAFLRMLRPDLAERNRITRNLAEKFAELAGLMRQNPDWQPMQIARFLTKIAFTLFVDDIGLLPRVGKGIRKVSVVESIIDSFVEDTGNDFVEMLQPLFAAMDGRTSRYYGLPVPYFNGGLFADSAPDTNNGVEVLDITQIIGAMDILRQVSEAEWQDVNPTIFGTLFEGALDENKRAQLGAHYTDEPDIRLVVEPVLMQPLRQQWDAIQAEATPLLQIYATENAAKPKEIARLKLVELHDRMMHILENTRVLDPACGSGNFLYVSLLALKDLEAQVRRFFGRLGLPFRDVVTPRQLYGIEKDEFAAKLAHVVVWIGYLQWRYTYEGVLHPRLPRRPEHPMMLPHPILQDKLSPDEPDRIVCADSILRYDADGKPYEPEWPAVDVIMGNPPFLGRYRLRGELGEKYTDDLFTLYRRRVPAEADLVTYWYERARSCLENNRVKRVGLLATSSITQPTNRVVLDRIKQIGNIFTAWSNKEWALEGAAIRISIIAFDNGTEKSILLNGKSVPTINADLTSSVDFTIAKTLNENVGIAFQGINMVGPFDFDEAQARKFLNQSNSSGVDNQDVIKRIVNARDITQRSSNRWIIDFGVERDESKVARYELPYKYLKEEVFPKRSNNARDTRARYWWLFGEPVPKLRPTLESLKRYIVSPMVSKHRIFVFLETTILPDHRLAVIARDDDYVFGVLHSTIHELWALTKSSRHGVGNDPTYNITTCFETFPFPYSIGLEETTSGEYMQVSEAARQLNEERYLELNPPQGGTIEADEKGAMLQRLTLTNFYNALEEYRAAQGNGKNGHTKETPAHKFAPRLAELHDALDQAVLKAYGWADLIGRLRTSDGDEELLRRLLALNLQRAGE